MTGRGNPLTVLKGGIARDRPKGGARADSLYDLVNAQITDDFQVIPRPGTRRTATLPEGTVGLTAFENEFHVYASTVLGFVRVTYTADDEFTVPDTVTQVTVLAVGGGGGGSEGGGGGGEVVAVEDVAVTPADDIVVTIGAGGTASVSGDDTTFGALVTALGGGGGGGSSAGDNGGSGGGGGIVNTVPGSSIADQGVGSSGGFGNNVSGTSNDAGGGGGGGGGVGANASNAVGGAGGIGLDVSDVFGTSVGESGVVGGGGGGGTAAGPGGGAGGDGGGGNAGTAFTQAQDGVANTGGGGGGGGTTGGSLGGSGVLVVQYNTLPEGFVLDVLLHPFDPDAELVEIHFAEPFLGALYVVAEFDDGQVYHYWLQEGETWEASTEYALNEFVTPTVANGYVYSANRLLPGYPAWAAGVTRTAGNGSSIDPSIIEPTTYNEYYYTCIATEGDPARSGSVEPLWPTNTGQTIIENTDGFQNQGANEVTPPSLPSANVPQASTTDRYTL